MYKRLIVTTFLCLGVLISVLNAQLPMKETADNGTLDLTWIQHASTGSASLIPVDSTGSTWGSWVFKYTDSSYTGLSYVDGALFSDYSIETDIWLDFEINNGYAGIAIRVPSDKFAYYRFVARQYESNKGQLRLQGYDGASWHIGRYFEPDVDFPRLSTGWHRMKITLIDNKFWVFIDGLQLPGCPYSDDDLFLTEGYPSLYKYAGGTLSILYDNFTVMEANVPPIANPRRNLSAIVGDVVTLDGTGSFDPDLTGTLTYLWEQVSGPSVTLSDSSSPTPTFTASTAGDYEFKLTVNDGIDNSIVENATVTVTENVLVEEYFAGYFGATRGLGVDEGTGALYISNTNPRGIHYFAPGNQTGVPNDTILHPDWDAWLGTYGLDVASDGWVYVNAYLGSNSAVWRFDPYMSEVEKIADVGENMRGLTVVGGGVSTEVYYLTSNSKLHRLTTADGVTFTDEELFDAGQNASIAVASDAIYTTGFKDSIKKWIEVGGAWQEDKTFTHDAALNRTVGIRMGIADTILYAIYDDVVKTDSFAVKIAKLNLNSGNIISSVQIGGGYSLYSWARPYVMDVVTGQEIFWAIGETGYNGTPPAYPDTTMLGLVIDVTTNPPNRKPGARARVLPYKEEIPLDSLVTLDGSRSGDIDGDFLTYTWVQISGPADVVLPDPALPVVSFNVPEPGDYEFNLVVSDGIAGDTAMVKFNVISRDFILTFEDDLDLVNWDGDLDEDGSSDCWTAVEWDTTGGLNGSGALRIKDGGYCEAIERPISATVGTAFRLTAYVKVKTSSGDAPSKLDFQVVGLTPEPIVVDIKDDTAYTKITLQGFVTNEMGDIQIVGDLPFVSGFYNYIWIDSLVFDDDAPVTTYTLSGHVSLSDLPSDSSGSSVVLVGYEDYFSSITDANADYSISGIVAGTYDILAGKFGYKDSLVAGVEIVKDTTINFRLRKNQPPVADAGADITGAQVRAYVTLDGSASSDPDDDPLIFNWTSPDTDIVIENADEAVAGFRPYDTGDYTFILVVNDGTEDSDPDSVSVSVTVEGPPTRGYEYVDIFYEPFQGSQGAVVDPNGRLWTASYYSWNPYLRIFNPDGTPAPFDPVTYGVVGTDTFEIPVASAHFYGIAIDKDGNIYYSDAVNHNIYKFNYQTGEPMGGIKLTGSPTMGVDDNGYIYAGRVVGTRIWIFDSNFALVDSVDLEYGGIGREVDVSRDGSTIFVGGFSGNVYRLSGSVGTGFTQIDNLPGPFNPGGDMSDIGFDSKNYLFVTEADNAGDDRLLIYDPDLNTREEILTDRWDRPRGTAFANGDSLLYIVDFGGGNTTIQRWAIPGTQFLMPIAKVRANTDNGTPVLLDSVVTVTGFVSVDSVFGTKGPGYIQTYDASYGVAIYDAMVDSIHVGDEISVTGTVGFYNGLTEIKNVTSFKIISTDNIVEPVIITGADLADTLGEDLEGILVKIENCTMDQVTLEGNKNYTVTDANGVEFTMRIDKDTDIPGLHSPTEAFDLIAVVSQYDGSSPYWSGYQVLPRNAHDLGLQVGVKDMKDLLPKKFALHQNYPNPFNPITTIKYDLPKDVRVKMYIYNILGQKIKTLVNTEQRAGYKMIRWNGTNDQGKPVASGTYFYKIMAGDFVKTKKMMIIK